MSLNDLSKLTELLPKDKLAGLSFDAYPLDIWHPEHCGVMNLTIKANGQWWHEGSEIKRNKLVLLFSKVLCREGETYYLKTPVEKIEIEVEDAPYIVVDYKVTTQECGEQNLTLITNIGDEIPLSQEFALELRGNDKKPYVLLKRGLTALISRAVFYDLIEIALKQSGDVGKELWLSSYSHRQCLGVF